MTSSFPNWAPNRINLQLPHHGEAFDKVYDRPPLTDAQTTLVLPGGATIVEFKVDYPGRYILVDHALSRMEKGLAGYLTVWGGKRGNIQAIKN
mgnify:CR=1 FL=1